MVRKALSRGDLKSKLAFRNPLHSDQSVSQLYQMSTAVDIEEV